MKKSGFLKNKRGITLVEMLVSAVILGITLGVLLNTFVTGRVAAAMSRHHLQAMEIARQKMEELRELGYSRILSANFGQIQVTIDDGGTYNEDVNFNDILDLAIDGDGNSISGTGEDLNGNGALDKRNTDDLTGALTVSGDKNSLDLCGLNDDDVDDALQIRIEVNWTERIWFQDKPQTEFIETYITKYGAL